MKILYGATFQKNLRRLSSSQKKLALEQLRLFAENPTDSIFQDHRLRGRLSIYRAFSVDADIRILYRLIHSDCIKVVTIGPHSKVYKW